jgi:two-component system response regulator FixJ
MADLPPVYVVDDDASLRNSLRFLLTNSKRRVFSYEKGEELLAELDRLEPGPVLLDVRMAGIDGLEVQLELARQGCQLPVVIMTGHGDISMAVRAMKAGAVDFLTKPFAREDLLAVLEQADARITSRHAEDEQRELARGKLAVLTPREYEVFNELARGLPNKSIGFDLGISSRTVEIHRANVMRKLRVHSFPEALRIAFAAGMPFESVAKADEPALPLGNDDYPLAEITITPAYEPSR